MHSCLSVVQISGDPDSSEVFLPVNQTAAADGKSSHSLLSSIVGRSAPASSPLHCRWSSASSRYGASGLNSALQRQPHRDNQPNKAAHCLMCPSVKITQEDIFTCIFLKCHRLPLCRALTTAVNSILVTHSHLGFSG